MNLTPQQRDVLGWIAAGMPERDWPDYTHRINARALANRNLVEISGHGPSWRATLTDDGRTTLQEPPVDKPAPKPKPSAIPIPADVDAGHKVVRDFLRHPDRLDVSDGNRERALRILQGLAFECGRRGHVLRAAGEEHNIEIFIGGEAVSALVYEEKELHPRPPTEAVAAAKYDWQRIPTVEVEEFSGRLAFELEASLSGRPGRWADRKRWSLESRLPMALEAAEDLARHRAESKRAAEAERLRKRRESEEALPKAQQAYTDALNRDRLAKQLEASEHARTLRQYAAAIESVHSSATVDGQPSPARQWSQWIAAEADRIDPTRDVDQLRYDVPERLPEWEVAKYMPRGMSVYEPPG